MQSQLAVILYVFAHSTPGDVRDLALLDCSTTGAVCSSAQVVTEARPPVSLGSRQRGQARAGSPTDRSQVAGVVSMSCSSVADSVGQRVVVVIHSAQKAGGKLRVVGVRANGRGIRAKLTPDGSLAPSAECGARGALRFTVSATSRAELVLTVMSAAGVNIEVQRADGARPVASGAVTPSTEVQMSWGAK